MEQAVFDAAVTADIKSIVARCVCGADDLPEVNRVRSYEDVHRIMCDHCGRIYYAPTQTECVRDWANISTSSALLAGVNRVLALLDDEADVVDGEHGNQIPNTAMRYAQELRQAIAQAREEK